jgi:hypothetical protein
MKIRSNYVSNSSSSSYLLVWNNGGKVEANGFFMTMDKYLKYIDSLNNYSWDSSQIESSTKEGVKKHIEENEYDDLKDLFNEIDKYENACYLRLNYDDELSRELLEWMQSAGIVKTLMNYDN